MSREYLTPGAYGKLPFWPEYLEVQVALPSSRELKRWIHEGRHVAGLGSESKTLAMPSFLVSGWPATRSMRTS